VCRPPPVATVSKAKEKLHGGTQERESPRLFRKPCLRAEREPQEGLRGWGGLAAGGVCGLRALISLY